jgi:hypothetical protein
VKKQKWLLLIPVLVLAGLVVWAETPLGPLPEAQAALQPDREVQVQSGPWLVFTPAEQAETGLILYPGGRVDPRSYAPLARAVSEEGYLVVIVPMPLNLAVFDPNEASQVIDAFPEIQAWALGGHSLGGAMAARFAYRSPGQVDGLVLLAAYPADSDDLSGSRIKVVSIYGTLDGLATLEKIESSRPLLPADTRWVAIEGGNHAQFGWYGDQPGDNPAAIGQSAQAEQTARAVNGLMAQIQADAP